MSSRKPTYLDPRLRGETNSRPLKVGETIRHALSEISLRGESHIPLLDSASITVSEVRISADLKNATAYVMPLAGANKEVILDALAENASHLRRLLSKKITLRYMPKIYYKLDESYEEAAKINQLLRETTVNSKPE